MEKPPKTTKRLKKSRKRKSSKSDNPPPAETVTSEPKSKSKINKTKTGNCETETKSIPTKISQTYIKDKFISVIDHLDAQVDKMRLEGHALVKKRDFLLTCIDLLGSDDQLQNIPCDQRKRISCYYKRLNKIMIHVTTIRDNSQERSLAQVNDQINKMIAMADQKVSCKRCQMFLNTFGSIKNENDGETGPIDRNFESALLGCTIDDQREVKSRLEALLDYMKSQSWFVKF